jgi:hypothetical protein
MKIYEIIWYNEDDYGYTKYLAIIIHAENEDKAIKNAKKYIKKMLKKVDLNDYEKRKVIDVTEKEVLSCSCEHIV